MKVPFFNVGAWNQQLEQQLLAAFREIIGSGTYILGERLQAFETELAHMLDNRRPGYMIGCNSGTDAIRLALLAHGVKPGDEVVTVANSAIPTAAAICSIGAIPVFAEVDAVTWMLDCNRLAERLSPKTKAIVPVHLYGNMADIPRIRQLLAELGRSDVAVIEDTAQAHGSILDGRQAGTIGDFGAFSFYPTKNLGALGDAGAVYCRSPEQAERLRQLRHYGQKDRYLADTADGLNSRLDELQAAFLKIKLPLMAKWNLRKTMLMKRYRHELRDVPVQFQQPTTGCTIAWHLCVVKLPDSETRDLFRRYLADNGVETLIHYPIPLHRQPAFAAYAERFAICKKELPVTEHLAACIVSLPLNPVLTDAEQTRIIEVIADFFTHFPKR
ncbi:MAG TPA: DegT/DnrJ/EryC1/StrS family aminotransferase [Bacilli bacterium]